MEQPVKRVFASYDARRDEMKLRIGKIGARAGDVLRLEERKEYRREDFLRDFETHKVESLKNVRLLMGEGLQMEVDGRKFALMEARLDAQGLRAILSAKIEGTNAPIRFVFDGERVTVRLFKDSMVTGLKSEQGLAINYEKGHGATRTFRLLDRFQRETLDTGMRLTTIPEREDGTFQLHSDSWLSQHVRDRLARFSGQAFLRQKGDVSEEICRYALSLTRFWKEIDDHPDNTTLAEGSRRNGPDSLQRLYSGELFYFEFKWWSVRHPQAYDDACTQAERYLERFPTYRGEKVVGAYIGLLYWDVESDKLEFYVERVI